jgi:hypothetical protein
MNNIKKEIFRLFDLDKRLDRLVRTHENNNHNKLTLFLKKKKLNYDYNRNNICITIGDRDLIYELNNNNKMTLKIKKCDNHPFITYFVSKKQESKFNELINNIKIDFNIKGEIFNAFKKYLTSTDIKSLYFKKIKQPNFDSRIEDMIEKYNKFLEKEIKIGKTYTKNIKIEKGYYKQTHKLKYLKLIKENKKTYQVEYEFVNNGKIINKRIPKKEFINFFDIKKKTKYDFKYEYDKLVNS